MFELPLVNPIKFIDHSPDWLDGRFQFESFNGFQDKRHYFQKWLKSDETRLQMLTDFTELVISVYDLSSEELVTTLPFIEMDNSVIGEVFKIYEVPINFSNFETGCYYFTIQRTNTEGQTFVNFSEPIHVLDSLPDSLLFKYRNSENDFGTIFDTGIEFSFRVEGVIDNFTPKSDDVIYNDQKRNSTKLSSVPFRAYTLFIGNAPGVPNWVADKVNRILSCDIVNINGDYYEKTEEAGLEIQRAEQYAFIGMSIEIMPVDNKFLKKYKTGTEPGSVTIVQKIKNYNNLTGALTVSGVFKNLTLLEKICIIRTGVPFLLTATLVDSDDPELAEVGNFEIDETVLTLNINYLFTDTQTLYLKGLTGVSFLSLIYKQLDEPSIPLGLTGTPNPYKMLGRGATVIYTELEPGFLDIDFNITTGLGNPGEWERWAINDGRNSTQDMRNLAPVGVSEDKPLGSTGGSDEVKIVHENLLSHTHKIAVDATSSTPNLQEDNSLTKNRNSGGNSNANLGGASRPPTLGVTSRGGGVSEENQVPLKIQNPYRAVMFVTKIQ